MQMDNASNNLYALRSLYRVLRVAQLSSFPILKQMPGFFSGILQEIVANQENPQFSYVLMETLAYIFKLLLQAAKGQLKVTEAQQKEAAELYTEYRENLRPILEMILQSEGNDLIGFAFEI